MSNSVIIGIIVLVIVGAVGFFALSGDDDADDDANTAETSNQEDATATDGSDATDVDGADEVTEDENGDEPATTGITMSEVAAHSTQDDCWTYINDKVYDITEYIPRHPGGDEILRACGADGTSLFEQRTTDDGEQVGSGTPHSANATAALEGFLIGDLATN